MTSRISALSRKRTAWALLRSMRLDDRFFELAIEHVSEVVAGVGRAGCTHVSSAVASSRSWSQNSSSLGVKPVPKRWLMTSTMRESGTRRSSMRPEPTSVAESSAPRGPGSSRMRPGDLD